MVDELQVDTIGGGEVNSTDAAAGGVTRRIGLPEEIYLSFWSCVYVLERSSFFRRVEERNQLFRLEMMEMRWMAFIITFVLSSLVFSLSSS